MAVVVVCFSVVGLPKSYKNLKNESILQDSKGLKPY